MTEKKTKPNEVEPIIPRYPIKELSAHAEALFSVRPEVLAGALHGIRSELTIDEVQRAIDQFLRRKVN